MSGTRTVPYGREDRWLLHVSFSQDVLPKPIYQLILSEDYNNRTIPFFLMHWESKPSTYFNMSKD